MLSHIAYYVLKEGTMGPSDFSNFFKILQFGILNVDEQRLII